MNRPPDYSLYLITDRNLAGQRTTLDIVRKAVAGGATCVQLREKCVSTSDFIAEALAIRNFLKCAHIPFFINDRIDIALAVDADGIHLGQHDMSLHMAKKLVGDSLLVGISAESLQDAVEAEKGGADYVSVSPVFATPTKTDTVQPLGLDGVRCIRDAVRIPVVAIGGINASNAGDIIRHGADGLAVISAIVAADDAACAAAEIRQAIEKARNRPED